MKTITIEVPRSGASVEFILRGPGLSGQAVVVVSDDVEIRLKEAAPAAATPKAPPAKASGKVTTNASHPTAHDLDAILKRLIKLKPSKRATAVNSIKAMFQLTAPISEETASKILEDLRRRGALSIDANNRIQFRSA